MNLDKKEPERKVPMTRQGFCINFEVPTESSEFSRMFCGNFGGGFGRFGKGFERGFRFNIQPKEFSNEEQIELLKKQKEVFEERLLAIGNQLKGFEKPLVKKPLVKKPLVKRPLKKIGKPLKKEKKKGGKK